MKLTIFTANCAGNASNPYYPYRVEAVDEDSFREAISLDHVSAEFKGSYRSNTNFIEADHIGMDVDNELSDKPEDWITPEDILSIFDGVSLAISTSRSHIKAKGSKSARPRFHVYFPIPATQDANLVGELKETLADSFSFFDKHALDAARFMYGNVATKVHWQEGVQLITDFLYDTFAE